MGHHTGYIEVFMQGKCGRNIETTFDIKWVIGTYGNWKSQKINKRTAMFIPDSRVGADYSFYIKSGFSIAPAFSLHNNFDIASVV